MRPVIALFTLIVVYGALLFGPLFIDVVKGRGDRQAAGGGAIPKPAASQIMFRTHDKGSF